MNNTDKIDNKDIIIDRLLKENIEKDNYIQTQQIELEDVKLQNEHLKLEIAMFKNRQFGRRSKQLDKKYPNLFNYNVFN